MLVKLVEKKGKNWDKLLGAVLLAYRTSPHLSTGETLFFLCVVVIAASLLEWTL